jgi:hypothetical protein
VFTMQEPCVVRIVLIMFRNAVRHRTDVRGRPADRETTDPGLLLSEAP